LIRFGLGANEEDPVDIKDEIRDLAFALRNGAENAGLAQVGVAERSADGTVSFEVRTLTGAFLKVTVEDPDKRPAFEEDIDLSPAARDVIRKRLDEADPVRGKGRDLR